jgi:hypothetical protein
VTDNVFVTLFAELAAEGRPPADTCSVAKLRDTLSEDDRHDLDRAFADPEITSAAISRVLSRRYDTNIKGHTVGRHRNGGCNCPRPA